MALTTEPTDALIPCPFCGSPDVAIADDLVTFNGLCNACGASSGYSSYRNGATWLWNRRTPQPTQAVPPATQWKDHQTAALVNELRDCAKEFHGTQQLRERLLHILRPLIDWVRAAQSVPPAGREPLTEVRRQAIYDEHRYMGDSGWEVNWSDVIDAVEAAHGIKGKEAGNADQ